MKFPRWSPLTIMMALLLIAATLRLAGWLNAPPGMRFDEMLVEYQANTIHDGARPIYIDELAEEPLYHYLAVIAQDAIGSSLFTLRWLSAMLGLIAVAAVYALGRQMFNARIGLIAATFSVGAFWALMYSRMGLRIIALPAFVLMGMLFLWRGLRPTLAEGSGINDNSQIQPPRGSPRHFIIAGILFGLSAYTYSATRLLPFVFIAFFIYLLLFNRSILRRIGLNLALMLIIALAIAAPMTIHIATEPVAERRLGEVEGPLDALQRGEVTPLINSTLITAGMFIATGDPETLYNIPNRPVFDLITGAIFYLGVGWCCLQIIKRKRRASELASPSVIASAKGAKQSPRQSTETPALHPQRGASVASARKATPRNDPLPSLPDAYAFLVIWLLVGLVPPMLTWPAASNSHGILAQSPAFLIAAIGLDAIADKLSRLTYHAARICVVCILLVLSIHSLHSIIDYFGTWVNLPSVRAEHAADLTLTTQYFAQNPVATPLVFSSGNVTHFNPWSATAFRLIAPIGYTNARWFDARSSFIFPQGATDLTLINSADDNAPAPLDSRLIEDLFPLVESSPLAANYFSATHLVSSLNTRLITLTQAVLNWPSEVHLDAPKSPIPFGDHMDLLGYEVRKSIVQPGKNIRLTTYWRAQDIGLQPLSIFVHVLNERNEIAAQWDGLTIDQHYVQAGDIIVQVHFIGLPLDLPEGAYTLQIGLYEYKTGSRIPIQIGGQAITDRVLLQSVQIKK
jgi:4-amino-4-deoxy-L-arabinose transferase-like glycosyltransferase